MSKPSDDTRHAKAHGAFQDISSLAFQMAHATEVAAIAAASVAGQEDTHKADHLAVEAMRAYLNTLPIAGTIVIGEGERDKAPMLWIGETVGTKNGQALDIAVDPLENTNAAAKGSPRATSVLAASEKNGLFHAPDIYMEKLVVGPQAKDVVHLDASVKENIASIAQALKRKASELVIVVLDRKRNEELIESIRGTGARVQLIADGDLIPGISVCMAGSSIHAVMGIGAAPEGVLTAAGIRFLQGGMQAKFWCTDEAQRTRLKDMGGDPDRVYTERDLASGNMMIFASTAVTSGDFSESGVRFFGDAARTDTLLIYSNNDMGVVRFHDTTHVFTSEGIQFRMK
jgi:fructose-1,6-bisphosphatase II